MLSFQYQVIVLNTNTFYFTDNNIASAGVELWTWKIGAELRTLLCLKIERKKINLITPHERAEPAISCIIIRYIFFFQFLSKRGCIIPPQFFRSIIPPRLMLYWYIYMNLYQPISWIICQYFSTFYNMVDISTSW